MKVNSIGYSLKDVLPSVSLKTTPVLADNKTNDPDTYNVLFYFCVYFTHLENILVCIVSRICLKRLLG